MVRLPALDGRSFRGSHDAKSREVPRHRRSPRHRSARRGAARRLAARAAAGRRRRRPPRSHGALPTIAKATAGAREARRAPHVLRRSPEGEGVARGAATAGKDGEVASYIYQESIATGLGSNPVGLDRGQLGDTRIVTLRRVGGRVLVEQPNLKFRALSEDPAERRAVRDSFATSILWAGEIAAQEPDGRRAGRLHVLPGARRPRASRRGSRWRSEGSWSLDSERSVVDPEDCKAFPDNVELEALLTYQSSDPGTPGARDGADAGSDHARPAPFADPPAGRTATSRALFDPRAGYFGVEFKDYAAPIARAGRHPLSRPPPAGEGRSDGGPLAGEEADRLLRRPRRAGADPQRPDRGGELVEGRRSTGPASSTPSRSRCCRRTPIRSTSATTSSSGSTARPAAGRTAAA